MDTKGEMKDGVLKDFESFINAKKTDEEYLAIAERVSRVLEDSRLQNLFNFTL